MALAESTTALLLFLPQHDVQAFADAARNADFFNVANCS
jgi:hypothetical protein